MIGASHCLMRRLQADERGATIVEMAFVAGPLCLLLMGMTEFGYRAFVTAQIEGTMNSAARLATVGDKTPTQITDFINKKMQIFSSRSGVTVSAVTTNYYDYSGIKKPEKIISDTAPLGVWNAGECYIDLDNDGKWDAIAGRAGYGGSDDIVYYKVTVAYPHIFPMASMMGWPQMDEIRTSTVLRNEPYAAQQIPQQKCTST